MSKKQLNITAKKRDACSRGVSKVSLFQTVSFPYFPCIFTNEGL